MKTITVAELSQDGAHRALREAEDEPVLVKQDESPSPGSSAPSGWRGPALNQARRLRHIEARWNSLPSISTGKSH